MGLGSIDVSGAQDPRGRKVRFRAGERIYHLDADGEPVTLRYAKGAPIFDAEEAQALSDEGYLIEEPSDEEEADVNAPETKDTPQPVKKGGSRKATTEKE